MTGVRWNDAVKSCEWLSANAKNPKVWIDPANGLAMVILFERFDMPGDQQKVMYGGFMKVAVAKVAKGNFFTGTLRPSRPLREPYPDISTGCESPANAGSEIVFEMASWSQA